MTMAALPWRWLFLFFLLLPTWTIGAFVIQRHHQLCLHPFDPRRRRRAQQGDASGLPLRLLPTIIRISSSSSLLEPPAPRRGQEEPGPALAAGASSSLSAWITEEEQDFEEVAAVTTTTTTTTVVDVASSSTSSSATTTTTDNDRSIMDDLYRTVAQQDPEWFQQFVVEFLGADQIDPSILRLAQEAARIAAGKKQQQKQERPEPPKMIMMSSSKLIDSRSVIVPEASTTDVETADRPAAVAAGADTDTIMMMPKTEAKPTSTAGISSSTSAATPTYSNIIVKAEEEAFPASGTNQGEVMEPSLSLLQQPPAASATVPTTMIMVEDNKTYASAAASDSTTAATAHDNNNHSKKISPNAAAAAAAAASSSNDDVPESVTAVAATATEILSPPITLPAPSDPVAVPSTVAKVVTTTMQEGLLAASLSSPESSSDAATKVLITPPPATTTIKTNDDAVSMAVGVTAANGDGAEDTNRFVCFQISSNASSRHRPRVIPLTQLFQLGYSESDILRLEPTALDLIATEKLARPRRGIPERWKQQQIQQQQQQRPNDDDDDDDDDNATNTYMNTVVKIRSKDELKEYDVVAFPRKEGTMTMAERARPSSNHDLELKKNDDDNQKRTSSTFGKEKTNEPVQTKERTRRSRPGAVEQEEEEEAQIPKPASLDRNTQVEEKVVERSRRPASEEAIVEPRRQRRRVDDEAKVATPPLSSAKDSVDNDDDASRQQRRERRRSYDPEKVVYNVRPTRPRHATADPRDDPPSVRFWPDMPSFRRMLKDETNLRVGILGRDWRDTVEKEADWRLDLYISWLRLLQNGIGEPFIQSRSDRRQPRAPASRRKRQQQQRAS